MKNDFRIKAHLSYLIMSFGLDLVFDILCFLVLDPNMLKQRGCDRSREECQAAGVHGRAVDHFVGALGVVGSLIWGCAPLAPWRRGGEHASTAVGRLVVGRRSLRCAPLFELPS
jgi:hypothetical protein